MKKLLLAISTIFVFVFLIYIIKYNDENSYKIAITLEFEDSFFSQYYNYKLTQPLLVERSRNNLGIMEVSSNKYNNKVVLNIKCSFNDCSDVYLSYVNGIVYKNMKIKWEKEKEQEKLDLENKILNIKQVAKDRFMSLVLAGKINNNNDFNIEEIEGEYKKLDMTISRMGRDKESYFFDLFSEKEFSEIKNSILELDNKTFDWDIPYEISQKNLIELNNGYYIKIFTMIIISLNIFVFLMAKLNGRFNKIYKNK
ncbi:hypothetical protein NI390_00660 [Vibrio fluvialis]|uniref:hypothetical protein n=1 Tax=Vibrio fluvialis TaxID=676 RepID=UPI0027E58602|nr:hypothetical protein [Vibrio fluvialis]WMN55624.1 hypothetical protein NI390_00660 [Vibrio fluvialis]